MSLKRFFGFILTLGGIGGLIYAAFLFMNRVGDNFSMRAMAMFAILGFIFFIAGIGLVRTTKDVPQ